MMKHETVKLASIKPVVDDPSLAPYAGLMPIWLLMEKLDLCKVADRLIQGNGRVGAANPGNKIATLVSSLLIEGSFIAHVDRLRAGATPFIPDFPVLASSTIGSWLRSFTKLNIGELKLLHQEMLTRAWALGARAVRKKTVVVDVDASVCEVSSTRKEGAKLNRNKKNGLHPIFAVMDASGEIINWKLRPGASQQGHTSFIAETVRRAQKALGKSANIIVRADSGFWCYDTIKALTSMGAGYCIAVRKSVNVWAAIHNIPETRWSDIKKLNEVDKGQLSQVADTTFVSSAKNGSRTIRIIVRRSRKVNKRGAPVSEWIYQAIAVSDHKISAVKGEKLYRNRARCELAIRDLQQSFGLSHLPSGKLLANAGWLSCVVLAYNMMLWCRVLGAGTRRVVRKVVGRTMSKQFFGLTGRLVKHKGQFLLRFVQDWKWGEQYLAIWNNILMLPDPHPP